MMNFFETPQEAAARATLLPRSGIGVAPPYLVIAPPGNPAIVLDCRLLDRVGLVTRPNTAPKVAAATAGAVLVGAALSFIPGGALTMGLSAYFFAERTLETRSRSRSRDLLLVLGSLEVALHVADGAIAARGLVDAVTAYTRSAPLTNGAAYEDAKRRVRSSLEPHAAERQVETPLAVGDDTVAVVGDQLRVGKSEFSVAEVRAAALRGANLPLHGGRLLQAALGLLVVAADERARKGDDVEALRKRISEFEAWSGASLGR